MSLLIRNRALIATNDPLLGQALEDVTQHLERLIPPSTPPSDITQLNVSAADGVFDISVVDNLPAQRGINYFLEYAQEPSFQSPILIDLGASRNWRGYLGNLTLYWRAYSAYPSTARSKPVVFLGNPVVGGGAAGPAPLPSQGGGTSVGGSAADGGFGNERTRDVVGKIALPSTE